MNDDRTCSLLQAINYNGLLFFLIANLMAGATNLLTTTDSYTVTQAFVILNVYMLIISSLLYIFTVPSLFLNLYRLKDGLVPFLLFINPLPIYIRFLMPLQVLNCFKYNYIISIQSPNQKTL